MKIVKEITVPGFKDYVESVRSCGEHPLVTLTPEVMDSVTDVIEAYIEEAETYEDTQSFILVSLADGSYGLFFEWSDSSGHG